MENKIKSLRERAKEFDSRLPFMDGRDKGDVNALIGQVCTLTDYGFLPGEDGENYAVFITKERSKVFFFAGSVLTARLAELDGEGYGDDIRAEGLPILMTKVNSKKTNRTYTNVVFYPEV